MKRDAVLLALILMTAVVLVAAPFLGMRVIAPADILGADGTPGGEADIFWKLRIPRTALAFLAGASLALAGMIFQALFRNDLASPFTLGVSSGAALGATLALRLGLGFVVLGMDAATLCALVGAALSVALVHGLGRSRPDASGATLLLAGVAVNFTLSSLILLVHYTSDAAQSFNILRWLMGRLDVVGADAVLMLLPLFAAGGLAGLLLHRELNLLTVGEEFAVSRGIDATRTRTLLFFGTSLLVGGVVAVCGPIGFVGMMTPHVARLLVGPDHRRLAPASLLLGGSLLTLCDVLSRVVVAPAEMPVGVITSLLGGPFFLWLLTRKRAGEP